MHAFTIISLGLLVCCLGASDTVLLNNVLPSIGIGEISIEAAVRSIGWVRKLPMMEKLKKLYGLLLNHNVEL